MSKRDLPAIRAVNGRAGLSFEAPVSALDRWHSGLRGEEKEGDNIISILDVIGEDFWTGGGVTAKRVSAALRQIGARDVIVHMNSPGGDLFEGIAIYNVLREHPHNVTVKVLGLAASAASMIAMAGDTIQIARAGFFMVHNVWALAVGNRHDLREIADLLEPFDAALADVYAARSGMDGKEIAEMMDRETWIGGTRAVESGFADSLLPSDSIAEDTKAAAAMTETVAARRMDALLARAGVARSDRRKLIKDIKGAGPGAAPGGTPGAAAKPMPSAGASALQSALSDLSATLDAVNFTKEE